ncbi:MAG: galactokinase [Streptosporangiales bacterium]|nr:galactokinase [Streptosporangiales bacterium]
MDATGLFTEAYGTAPAGVWQAPGRVNLIGEHTDYNDGFVLPMALPMGVRAAVTRLAEDRVEVVSRQRPDERVTFAPSGLAPGSVPGWAAYVAGVFWALRNAGHKVGGARVAIDADLPRGAGLSSSAALECAVAVAINDLYELGLPVDGLAPLAREAENAYVGAPTGIMDQSASLRCREGRALYLDCRSLAAGQVPFDLAAAGMRLLVIDTRVKHRLADGDGGYAQRRAECERAAGILGVPALRDVEDLDAALRTLDDPVLRRRVRHVVTENHRVNATVGLMRAGAFAEVGALFNASHISLRDDFQVSAPELDVAVEAAIRGGARGARMTGGGFGGCAVALLAAERADPVREAVTSAYASRRWKTPRFWEVTPAAGARRLDPA